jgi:hypothetical protein
MAESKPEPKKAPAPKLVLARASESGDPAVHQLMGEIQTAQMNNDDAKVAVLSEQLAELGYC